MKIFLDTNFIVDLYLRPEFRPICKEVLSTVDYRRRSYFISYLTVANFAFIARKLDKDLLREMIQSIMSDFEVVSGSASQIEAALLINGSDFEDILQYQAAKASKCDVIITRNQKDFSFSEIPFMSPQEYLSKFS